MAEKKKENNNAWLIWMLVGFGAVKLLTSNNATGAAGGLGSDYYTMSDFQASTTAEAQGYTEQFLPPPPEYLQAGRYFVRELFDPLTKHFGAKFPIESWWRSPRLNIAVGGAANSFHKFGGAVDTKSGVDYRPVIKYILSSGLPFTELILYGHKSNPGHIHIALTEGRENEKEILFKKATGDYETVTPEYINSNY